MSFPLYSKVLLKNNEFFRCLCQDFAALFSDQNNVLDPNAAPIWNINTRFDCNDHARFQHALFSQIQIGSFVDDHTHGVSQSMSKVIPIASVFDNFPSYCIDFFSCLPWCNCSNSCPLGCQYDLINFSVLFLRFAQKHCPCYIGAVTLIAVSYTHLQAHETRHDLVCRLLLEK